jgi:hypothetical protein
MITTKLHTSMLTESILGPAWEVIQIRAVSSAGRCGYWFCPRSTEFIIILRGPEGPRDLRRYDRCAEHGRALAEFHGGKLPEGANVVPLSNQG